MSPSNRDLLIAELNTLAKIWHYRHLYTGIDEFWNRSLAAVEQVGTDAHSQFHENKILSIIDATQIDTFGTEKINNKISESVSGVLSGYDLTNDEHDYWSFIGEHACRANLGSDELIKLIEGFDRPHGPIPLSDDGPFLMDFPTGPRLN